MRISLLSAVCACVLVSSGTVYSASFTGLGVSSAKASPDGSFLFNDTSRWTAAGGWQAWDSYSGGTLIGGVSEVSYDGSVVAGSLNGTAYRWSASSGMVGLGSFPGDYTFSVSGISTDGSVIAGTGTDTSPNSDNTQAYRWTATTGMVGLTGAVDSFATGISADGYAVIGNIEGFLSAGYWMPDGSYVEIAHDSFVFPTAISADASVIAGNIFNRNIFRWTATDGFEDLNINLPEVSANDMSADGSILVGYRNFLSTPQNGAWIWDETNGTRSIQDMLIAEGLDLTGWDLWGAESISADGTIITGWGWGPSGVREAWVADFSAVLVPATVDIDIKPGDKRNIINPRARGGIWVAVLSDTDPESPFDPSSQVDIPTVEFGTDSAKANRHKVKDLNRDGLGDLLLRFKIPETGFTCGDTEATLTGKTFDGQSFTGTDSIKTVGCKRKKHHHEHRDKKYHNKR